MLASTFTEKYDFAQKENKAIKDRIIRDTRNLFEHEEENYYKPVRVFCILDTL